MNIGIIGLGLIGGSFGRAILKKTDHFVLGHDIMSDVILKAEIVGAISSPLKNEDYSKLDIIIIALNPRAFSVELEKIAPKLKKGAIVIDIGGNKKRPVNAMKKISVRYPSLQFLATHPMAGKEFSGIAYSSETLFEHASILVVPVKAEIETLTICKKLFLDIGFDFIKITNEFEHDKIVAYTSQLAHIISSAYINSPLADGHDGFSAGSFKDLSRVSRNNPAMWAELLTDNKENVLNALDIFISQITKFKEALSAGDEDKVKQLFLDGNNKKEQIDKVTREWKKNNFEK